MRNLSRSPKYGFIYFALVLVAVVVATKSFAAENPTVGQKIEHAALELAKNGKPVDVMVVINRNVDLSATSKMTSRNDKLKYVYNTLRDSALKTQNEAQEFLRERNVDFRSNYLSNTIQITHATEKLMVKLANLDSVKAIKWNRPVKLLLPGGINQQALMTKEEMAEIPAHLTAINADKVWNQLGFKGEGMVIAGHDTGYTWEHPAITKQYRGNQNGKVDHNYNWHDSVHTSLVDVKDQKCAPESAAPCDDHSHGTHTMGTMLGDDGGENKIGVAPKATWIGCRNMDHGTGTPASYLECFEFFLAPYPVGGNAMKDGRPEMAPHVINNSWGCPGEEGCMGEEFVEVIRHLKAAGVMTVASAGNEGSSCGSTGDAPGFYAGEVLSVAAMDHKTGAIASFSSRGPSKWNGGLTPNITAPGVSIRSALAKLSPNAPYSYGTMSGTSMSGPHVAGAIALIWSARPDLVGQVDRTMEQVFKTAIPKTSTQNCGSFKGDNVPNAVFGYGVINTFDAIQSK